MPGCQLAQVSLHRCSLHAYAYHSWTTNPTYGCVSCSDRNLDGQSSQVGAEASTGGELLSLAETLSDSLHRLARRVLSRLRSAHPPGTSDETYPCEDLKVMDASKYLERWKGRTAWNVGDLVSPIAYFGSLPIRDERALMSPLGIGFAGEGGAAYCVGGC